MQEKKILRDSFPKGAGKFGNYHNNCVAGNCLYQNKK